jgi:phospholipid/cholesterol/gamma-HCH transport system ATP-binding protein
MSAVASDDAIRFEGVTKRFGARVVVESLDLAIPAHATTVLLGPSGTGKSTLLRLAAGLMKPDAGRVFVLGEDVHALKRKGLLALRRRFGMLFQENALFSSMSARENVMFPLLRIKKLSETEAGRQADELLASVGLPEVGDRLPDALSGGQKKRVALARALALEPEMVLFDEPTSGLDPQTSASIDELISHTQARLKTTFLVITHDIASAAGIAHHIGLLLDGHLRAFGPRDAVLSSTDPPVRAFLDRRPLAG